MKLSRLTEHQRELAAEWHSSVAAFVVARFFGRVNGEMREELVDVGMSAIPQAAAAYRPGGPVSFKTYAMWYARGAIGNHLLKHARIRQHEKTGRFLGRRQSRYPDPSTTSEARDFYEWAIPQLKPHQQRAFALVYGEGLNTREAGGRLGLSGNAVSEAIRSGLNHLRTLTAEQN